MDDQDFIERSRQVAKAAGGGDEFWRQVAERASDGEAWHDYFQMLAERECLNQRLAALAEALGCLILLWLAVTVLIVAVLFG